MRNMALSLPSALVQQLKRRAVADRVSQPEVLMDALSATKDDLPKLVAHMKPVHAPAAGDLFVRVVRRGGAEPMSTLTLRILSRNLDAIDRLVTLSEAPSRSMMCATALRAYLAETQVAQGE